MDITIIATFLFVTALSCCILCGYVIHKFMQQHRELVELALINEVKEKKNLEIILNRYKDKRARKRASEQTVAVEDGLL